MTELVGADCAVTTVDVDPEIIARARLSLQTAGYDQVQVVHADAEHGVPGHAPYDRMSVTVKVSGLRSPPDILSRGR